MKVKLVEFQEKFIYRIINHEHVNEFGEIAYYQEFSLPTGKDDLKAFREVILKNLDGSGNRKQVILEQIYALVDEESIIEEYVNTNLEKEIKIELDWLEERKEDLDENEDLHKRATEVGTLNFEDLEHDFLVCVEELDELIESLKSFY